MPSAGDIIASRKIGAAEFVTIELADLLENAQRRHNARFDPLQASGQGSLVPVCRLSEFAKVGSGKHQLEQCAAGAFGAQARRGLFDRLQQREPCRVATVSDVL